MIYQRNACLLQAGGLDNVGKINSDVSRYFYLNDHLGSICAVVDATYGVVSAQDGVYPAPDAGICGLRLFPTGQ